MSPAAVVPAAPKGAAPTLGSVLGMACELCFTEDRLVLLGALDPSGQWRSFRVCLCCRASWEVRSDGVEVLVREERAPYQYVAEPCEVYTSPPSELLAQVRGLLPEGVWLSVQWWSPPVLEVSVWQVSGQCRWVTLEVLPA